MSRGEVPSFSFLRKKQRGPEGASELALGTYAPSGLPPPQLRCACCCRVPAKGPSRGRCGGIARSLRGGATLAFGLASPLEQDVLLGRGGRVQVLFEWAVPFVEARRSPSVSRRRWNSTFSWGGAGECRFCLSGLFPSRRRDARLRSRVAVGAGCSLGAGRFLGG